MRSSLLSVVMLFCLLSGCAHVMSPVALKSVDHSIAYADIKRNPEALAGRQVLLGGVIAESRSSGDVLYLEVAQLELLANGVPDEMSVSGGRFLLVSGQLLDPLFYRPGMLVTVIGEIKGQTVQKLLGVDYRYPLLSAKELRTFRASEPMSGLGENPYQNRYGDSRQLLRPPGEVAEEPRKLY